MRIHMKKLLLLLLLPSLTFADGLPNKTLTPGSLNPDVTISNMKQTICVPKYSDTIRPSSYYTNKLKIKQLNEYGYADKNPKNYEEDHLVPLSIGGHPTDPRNLWPQPRLISNSAAKKDVFERWAHRAVCSGKVDLKTIQHYFANDWLAGYNHYIK